MMDILSDISTWSVFKWVALVLIAGFIGQFGRMMAEAISARVRLRRARQNKLSDDARPPESPSASPDDVSPEKELSANMAAAAEKSEKKALKILAKARKKEAKKK